MSPIVEDDREIVVRQYRLNLDIGEKGEQFVLAYEKESLKDTPHLARRVNRVSLYAPRAGYDIQSYFPDGRLKFIEVKATTGNDTHFEMTHNEWMTAKRLGNSYFVYRITNINNNPQMLQFRNPADVLGRQPLVWKVNYSSEITQPSDLLSHIQANDIQHQLRLATLLQELPKEKQFFTVYGNNRITRNKFYIKMEDVGPLEATLCTACGAEDKPVVRVGFLNRGQYIDLQICVDCFLNFRELFL